MLNTESTSAMEGQLRSLLAQLYSGPAVQQQSDSNQMNADDFRMYVYKVRCIARAF